MSFDLSNGPLMLDIEGVQLNEEDRALLAEPAVGGLILFSRNFESLAQLQALLNEIRQIRPGLLIGVDHEGGRVQRFRQSFSRIPPMGKLGELYRGDPEQARQVAFSCGWLLAAELLAVGVDFSFAPVLDREYGRSRVIGDRAFSDQPEVILALAESLIEGMHQAGMATTGKHFPGHGYVVADSHVDIPRDVRQFETISADDMSIFSHLIQQGKLNAIMPAHVIYEQVDASPAGFSRYWLQEVLREQLRFEGVIFSDDLSMEGAGVAGSYAKRAEAALAAGCDMVLVCNNRAGALEVLEWLKYQPQGDNRRLQGMKGVFSYDWEALLASQEWQLHHSRLKLVGFAPEGV